MPVPANYASPNPAENSTITRGNALVRKMGILSFPGETLYVSPVGLGGNTPPEGTITVAMAEAQGVLPDDLVHLMVKVAGVPDGHTVATLETVIGPGTVDAVQTLEGQIYDMDTPEQVTSRTLSAISRVPAVEAALKTALG